MAKLTMEQILAAKENEMLFNETEAKEVLLEQVRHYKMHGVVCGVNSVMLLFQDGRSILITIAFGDLHHEETLPDGSLLWGGPRESMLDKLHRLFAEEDPDAVVTISDMVGDSLLLVLGQPEGNLGCKLEYQKDRFGRIVWGDAEWGMEYCSVFIPYWKSNPQQSNPDWK